MDTFLPGTQGRSRARQTGKRFGSAGERGTIATIVAIMMPVVLGCLGLAIDNGMLYAEKRQMQTAADATALAAAHEWRQQNYSGYVAAAKEDAAKNGFEVSENVDIDVNVPPKSGPRAGDTNFVEVIIRENVPLMFMRALRSEPALVKARAVAGLVAADACVYVLDKTAAGALTVAGDAKVKLEGCGVHVNSSNTQAARTMGGGQIDASAIGIVGDYTGSGYFPVPQTGIYPADDPLESLPAPSVGSCVAYDATMIKDTVTLNPGTYCDGIRITATGNVTVNPGMYVLLGGGLEVQAAGKLKGDGVTFYNTKGPGHTYQPITFASAAVAQLSAPTSGTYKGILFFQDRDVISSRPNTFSGTPDSYFTGVLYFPTTDVNYVGTSSTEAQKTLILARTAEFHGTSDVTVLSEDSGMLPTALAVARVVE